MAKMPLLEIRQLTVTLPGRNRPVRVLTDVSLEIAAGETLGLVGESGAGKTMTALSILKLLPTGAKVRGQILYQGNDLFQMSERAIRGIRGHHIAVIFQDPLAALDPIMRIDQQLTEGMIYHLASTKQEATRQVAKLLKRVGIAEPETCLRSYPHQLSGGMRQRALIAGALSCKPRLLICDEITSSLDAVTQLRLLALLRDLRKQQELSILFISHNLRVVSGISDRVAVMQKGRVLESGAAKDVLRNPATAYTANLTADQTDLNDVHAGG
jgi:ABC-type dipeptide/oligopeptide/nickel transport system ATPase component